MVDRVIKVATAAVLAVGIGLLLVRTTSNPMDARLEALQRDIARATAPEYAFDGLSPVDYSALDLPAAARTSLWRELIAATPTAAPTPSAPDIAQRLTSVDPTRNQMRRQGVLLVLIRTPEKPAGAYYGIGDKINGVEIMEFTRAHVIFGMKKNGRVYKHRIARK